MRGRAGSLEGAECSSKFHSFFWYGSLVLLLGLTVLFFLNLAIVLESTSFLISRVFSCEVQL